MDCMYNYYWTWGNGLILPVIYFIFFGGLIYVLVSVFNKHQSKYVFPAANQDKCPNCHCPVDETFIMCPECHFRLKTNCPSCGKMVKTNWDICPFCENKLNK